MIPVVKVWAWRSGPEGLWYCDSHERQPSATLDKPAILILCDSESEREQVIEAIQAGLAAVAFAKTLKVDKT